MTMIFVERYLIITTELKSNPYWMYSGLLTKKEVLEFFKKKEDTRAELLDKVAYYILCYAENVVLAGTFLAKDLMYLQESESFLDELRDLYEKVKNTKDSKEKYKHVKKMIDTCLDHNIDPF